MKRLRCGETSCVYHINGCTAQSVQVSAQQPSPCCSTYEPQERAHQGKGRFSIPDGLTGGTASRFARTEFGDAEPARRSELYRVSCTASDCLRNHDCMCRAAWLEIGFPKEFEGLDIRCKSYVSGCGMGRSQNK